jgi:hypothetical protein
MNGSCNGVPIIEIAFFYDSMLACVRRREETCGCLTMIGTLFCREKWISLIFKI